MAGAGDKKSKTEKEPVLSPELLRLLVCPLTKQRLEFNARKSELISVSARLAYPVRGGIPIMLPSEARPLKDRELKSNG